MNENVRQAARAHLDASTEMVQATLAYEQADAAAHAASALAGLAHERRVQARATLDAAFARLTAALKEDQ